MAYLQSDWNQDEEDKGQEAPAGGQETLSQDQGTIMGSSPAAAGGGPAKKGTGFVNIGRYLDANKTDIPGQTQAVAGKVEGQVKGAQGALSLAQGDFNKSVDEANTGMNQNLVKSLYSDPTAITKSKTNKADVSRMTSGTWNPPVMNDAEAEKQYSQAQGSLANTETAGGQTTLLRDVYGRPTYTSGEVGLDRSIIGADPNSQGSFAALRDKYKGLGGELEGARTAAQKRISDKTKEAGNTAKNWKEETGKAVEYWQGELDKSTKAANAQREAEWKNLKAWLDNAYTPNAPKVPQLGGIGGGARPPTMSMGGAKPPVQGSTNTLQKPDFSTLKLPNGQTIDTYINSGFDIRPYLSQGRAVTAEDIGTADQRAQMAALAELSGQPALLKAKGGKAPDYYSFKEPAKATEGPTEEAPLVSAEEPYVPVTPRATRGEVLGVDSTSDTPRKGADIFHETLANLGQYTGWSQPRNLPVPTGSGNTNIPIVLPTPGNMLANGGLPGPLPSGGVADDWEDVDPRNWHM
jgi:hypothetical protein